MHIENILTTAYVLCFSILNAPCLPFAAGGVMHPHILLENHCAREPTLYQVFDMVYSGRKKLTHCPEAWMYISNQKDSTWQKRDVLVLPQMMPRIRQKRLDVWAQDNHMAHPELFIKSGQMVRATIWGKMIKQALTRLCQQPQPYPVFIPDKKDPRSITLEFAHH